MANEDHFKMLQAGTSLKVPITRKMMKAGAFLKVPPTWNDWRSANPEVKPDLSRSNLSGTNLSGTNLSGTNLSGTYLSKAYLHEANLSEANLHEAFLCEANLSQANLDGADLSWSCLSGASLRMANLRKADLSGADLDKVDLCEARVGFSTFVNVDLSNVKGIETIVHCGPSSIGIDTIYRSQGNIPEIFLRGAGIPDPFIANMKSLVAAMSPIQFYSCFISYSSKDQEFAERLYADLQAKGVRCWFAPEDLKIGDPFRQRIDDAIRRYDKLLVVLSETSVASSWVESEVEAAMERERTAKGQVVLFPIRLDEAVMKTGQAWAADIRRKRHMGDFSHWHDHNSYQKAFQRLLRDLQGAKTGEGAAS